MTHLDHFHFTTSKVWLILCYQIVSILQMKKLFVHGHVSVGRWKHGSSLSWGFNFLCLVLNTLCPPSWWAPVFKLKATMETM